MSGICCTISPAFPLVMTHFPKSAGTALRLKMESEFNENLIADYTHDPLVCSGGDVVNSLPPGAVGVYGHFNPGIYSIERSFRATFLREPVNNLISIYYFWLSIPKHGNPVHDRFLAEKPSLLDFSRYPKLQTLMSDTYFGGFDMKKFNFVGFYERYDLDCQNLFRQIGISSSLPARENVTSHSEERFIQSQDVRILESLRSNIDQDVRFYNRLLNAR